MKYLLSILTVAFLATAYTYPAQARAFPVAAAWVMLFLIALDVFSKKITEDHPPAAGQLRAVAWLVAFAAALVLIGILYAVPLYIAASLRFRGHRSWLTSLLTAAITTTGLWLLFAIVLRLDLYPGIL
jgi:Tripartite tricarboxylate transporter TctB family